MTTDLSNPRTDIVVTEHVGIPDLHGAAMLDIAVPVHDEAVDLEPCVRRLHDFVRDQLPVATRLTIVDNASTDGTWDIAARLARELPGVRAIRLEVKGRGRALHTAWRDNDAAVVAYLDVDLSTDLAALHPLVAPLLSGHSDLAIGTRLSHGSRVIRGPKRELISRAYNALLHTMLHTRFSDAQCGFKAIRRDCAELLLPLVQDREWFFDTELLVLAERAGLRIHEVPVDWTDDPDSRVHLTSTAVADLHGVVRLWSGFATGRIRLDAVAAHGRPPVGRGGLTGQILRFAGIGVASTAAYLFVYLVLRGWFGAFTSNAIALVLTAVANTAANRRLTFAVTNRAGVLRHHLQGLLVFTGALGLTTAALAALHAVDAGPSRPVEVVVLVGANLVATVVRFLLLRGWVFAADRATPGSLTRSRR